MKSTNVQASRRRFLKTVAYTAPVIVTLQATAAHARTGSYKPKCNNGVGNGGEGCNPGKAFNNDEGFTPGNPGGKNKH
jgi:hypothetical protein